MYNKNGEDASRNFPGCCWMDRHSMGFSDDRHHPVGIQRGLIGADSDGESDDSPEQDMLLHRHLCVAVKHFPLCVAVKHFPLCVAVKHFPRSWTEVFNSDTEDEDFSG